MQLEIDVIKEAAASPGAGRRTPVVLASQPWPPSSARKAIRPQDCAPGVGLVNGKEMQ